jgi:hypothetical protein
MQEGEGPLSSVQVTQSFGQNDVLRCLVARTRQVVYLKNGSKGNYRPSRTKETHSSLKLNKIEFMLK